MPQVKINSDILEVEKGTSLKSLAQQMQKEGEARIVLAFVDHHLLELHHTIKKNCELEWVRLDSKPGMDAYKRTAVLCMIKAFYSVVSKEKISSLKVEFSLGDALFIQPEGDFVLDAALLQQVKDKMDLYIRNDYPLKKHSIHTADAIEMFQEYHMDAKARLFRYRRTGRVTVYSLGWFDDYFYGPMVNSAGVIEHYDLLCYKHGFLLHLPSMKHPDTLADLQLHRKNRLFKTLVEANTWARQMNVSDVGSLNDQIASQKTLDLILIQEALQEKKIADIARDIQAHPEKKLVMIAGPSSSGKTTFSHRLATQLSALGLHPHPIEVDDYFVDRQFSPRHADGSYNFEALECLDVEQFNRDMSDLLAGKRVQLPHYNFEQGKREYKGEWLQLEENDILIMEGIHCLNDKLSYSLNADQKYKIYISALCQLNIDEHNYVPTTDIRLIRRICRDSRTRGVQAKDTIAMWDSVRQGEEQNIFPFQEDVDVMFNSASIYELAVMKPYIEPLLFQIDPDTPEGFEANRLLKFLDYFLTISSENVPNNSIIREFIGGSCFNV